MDHTLDKVNPFTLAKCHLQCGLWSWRGVGAVFPWDTEIWSKSFTVRCSIDNKVWHSPYNSVYWYCKVDTRRHSSSCNAKPNMINTTLNWISTKKTKKSLSLCSFFLYYYKDCKKIESSFIITKLRQRNRPCLKQKWATFCIHSFSDKLRQMMKKLRFFTFASESCCVDSNNMTVWVN